MPSPSRPTFPPPLLRGTPRATFPSADEAPPSTGRGYSPRITTGYAAAEHASSTPSPELAHSARTFGSAADAGRALSTPVRTLAPAETQPVATRAPGGFTEKEIMEWMAKHPQNKAFTLSNGRTILLPMQIRDMEFMQVIGNVKADVMNEYLAPLGLEMVTLPFTNIGSAALTVINYRDTSIGPYQELVVGVFVRDKKNPLKTGFKMIHLYVTTEMSRDVGREVWGFPKEVAEVKLDPARERHQGFSVSYAGLIVASGKWNKILPMPSWLPGQQTAVTARQWVGFESKYRGMKMGTAGAGAVQFSENTEWGALLSRAGFTPRMWQGAPHGMGVIMPPK